MQEYDSSVPKTLLSVGGRPFADWQLSWLAAEGVQSVVYSIGFKGDLVRAFVGDGRRWGLDVVYVQETENLLGTGGAIRLAADHDVLHEHFFVLYGDSYLRVSLAAVNSEFALRNLPAIMTVFANDGKWDASNVVFDGRLVIEYQKHSVTKSPAMRYIDYGLLEITREVVVSEIPPGRRFELAAVLESLSQRALLGGFEVFQRFFEIGSPQGIEELNAFFKSGQPEA